MQYDIPPKQAQITQQNPNSNSPISQEPVRARNFGGIFIFPSVSGTSVNASATGPYYTHSVSYIPLTGPIASEELKLQQINKNMEQAAELRVEAK